MLKRGAGGKSSYSPYSITDHKAKKTENKGKSKLDILPNKPNVWLKQLSVLQEQPRQDTSDVPDIPSCGPANPSSSCPGTPLIQHARPAGCPSPATPMKRSSALSRHASAAGFPLQSWVLSKGLSRGAAAPGPESGEGPSIEVEDIPVLLHDVARFAEAMEKLRDAVLREGKVENRQALSHESLGEVLRVLRQVISTYPLLNTVETLTAAGTLISKVKGFQYDSSSDSEKKDFEKAIETIAVAFSSNVSELLMGEVDSSTLLSLLPAERSRSMENLYRAASGQGADSALTMCEQPHCALSAEEVDIILQHCEGGVESALSYAKSLSKYMKDVVNYVDKRVALEAEFARGLQKLYQSCKPSFEQAQMPFVSTYSMALEQDLEQSLGILQASSSLHTQQFLQPLTRRKQEHERRCKEMKEQWQKARRKLVESENNLRKAKQTYVARGEEYDKARAVASKAEEEGAGSTGKSLDKKRRQEEEARNKAEEAEATYRTCLADATTQHQEMEDTKVTVLQHIQEVIKQSDLTLRSATVSYCQVMHMQTVALPVHYQALCENSKIYELGQQYATFVKDLDAKEEPEVHYEFEPYTLSSPQESINAEQEDDAEPSPSPTDSGSADGVSPSGKQRHGRGHQFNKSWPTVVSDTDSVGEGSNLGSPTNSTGDVRIVPRTLSSGTMSSTEELDDKEGTVGSFEPSMNGVEPETSAPTGLFRNVGLSKAAQTHRLRKLRTPAKCRECDSYVYFQGAECEECLLACHKKCLESLAIQCGHKKLQGRLQLFGRDFSQASHCNSEGIPFIVKKCVLEIERRALKLKGIYRVNGVKTRVEKLCQAFENGKELVELSQASPHDISNVLKLYLRQLPEPIMPFRLYSDLIGLAKESLQTEAAKGSEAGKAPSLQDIGMEVKVLVEKLREIVNKLPQANIAVLGYIVRHLCRVAALEQDNKMSASNLGIVFGPALMRPVPSSSTVSLSSLVDYPHQARIVEMLIAFCDRIFSASTSTSRQTAPAHSHTQDSFDKGSRERCEGAEDGDAEAQSPLDSPKTELCDPSVSCSGSREQSLDSESEVEPAGDGRGCELSQM